MEFSVAKYNTEWGIFCKTSNCYVVFFKKKKEAKQYCEVLNEEEKKNPIKRRQYDYMHE